MQEGISKETNPLVSINAVVPALASHTIYPITLRKHITLSKMSNKVAVSKSKTQATDMTKSSQPSSLLFLDQLNVDVSGTIVVMIGRMWDVNAITGRYLSTDFVVSNSKSLMEPPPYARLLSAMSAFSDTLFQLVSFDRIEATNNKYLIGRTTYQKSGSRTLDFYLTNQRSQALRLTLWGGLGDVLIEKKTKHAGMYKLYLSSSSSKAIYDDENILLKTKGSVIESSKHVVPGDCSQAKEGTLENTETFHCKVMIKNVKTRKGWNYPSCGGGGDCKKGASRQLRKYRLELGVADDTAHVVVVLFDEPATELMKCSVESLLASVDESADEDTNLPAAITNLIGMTHMLELKSHTYYEYGTFESFSCWKINLTPLVEEGASTSTVEENAHTPSPAFKRLLQTPSVCTPSKGPEEKKKKRSEVEDSDAYEGCGSSKKTYECDVYARMDKKKKKRPVHSEHFQHMLLLDIVKMPTDLRHDGQSSELLQSLGLTDIDVLMLSSTLLISTTPPPLQQLLDYNDPTTSKFRDQNYQDAVALCRAYGNPDLFITFTSNPKWPEIAKMLAYFPGQKSHDRPKIGTRVFKIKLTELLDDLIKNNVFGESQAVVYVIDFQKHGLPHAHILLWLEEHCKCTTPSQIDDIISVELPSPLHDPEGYQVVTKYMLHGPCGKDARYAPCTNEGKCSKHFPESFLEETVLDEDGYPSYRRRENKVTVVKESLPALLEREGINITMFADWFELNKCSPAARTLTYDDIPKHYVCMTNKRLCATFKETCFAYGLLNDDKEWSLAISEASLPLKLWEDNWKALSEDIVHKKRKLFKYPDLQLTDEQIQNYCLMRVNEYSANGDLDTSRQEFNIWVLAVGDGKLPAKKRTAKMKQHRLTF
ncbi:replication protein A 70 kDa DNA-binding subunit C-like protein [Tanacetum coccineum]